uniref:Spinster homolog 2 (Drosophila) n=1 Tax=Sinocyclocheilus rhinocerous TaxID=307959 RepID=A0A673GIN0_9TELE
MCVESDGCEIEGCSSSDEVHTLSGSMSPALKSSPDLHPCKPGQKFRAALLRCRSPLVAAGILSFGNVLNYMDRYTVAGKTSIFLAYGRSFYYLPQESENRASHHLYCLMFHLQRGFRSNTDQENHNLNINISQVIICVSRCAG